MSAVHQAAPPRRCALAQERSIWRAVADATDAVVARGLERLAPRLAGERARRLAMTPRRRPMMLPEINCLAQARPLTFRFGLAGLAWGERGPVALLVHGWEGRPTQFADLVAGLLGAGYRVVALEAPAHGRSPGREAHAFAFVEAVLEAAAELLDVDLVVGHSMGAAAVLLAAHRGLRAGRLVAIATPPSLPRALRRIAGRLGLGARATRAFRAAFERRTGEPARAFDLARLPPPTVPTLLVHDRGDREVPFVDIARLRRAWPTVALLETGGLGHVRLLADPRVTAAVLAFAGAAPAHGGTDGACPAVAADAAA